VFVIALTGNYGMGKSSVLALFEKLGAVVLDSDRIVGALLTDSKVIDTIKAVFGKTVFSENGSFSKEKLAEIVFRDEALRHSLEDILHPLVFDRIDSLLAADERKDMIAIIEVPLLFERGYENRFNRTITVFTDEETALQRLEAKGIDRVKAHLRLKTQFPIDEKKRRSDYMIDNTGTPEETEALVETLYNKLLEEAKDGNNKRT
jgi:dephospho-CoA kinase